VASLLVKDDTVVRDSKRERCSVGDASEIDLDG